MGLAEWWKTSSAKAGEDYYKLRFDETEINNLRRGVLDEAMKAKIRARLRFVGKIDNGVLIGCGIPSGCLALIIISTVGFFFLRALYRNVNPISVGFSLFFIVFLTLFVFLGSKGLKYYLSFKKSLAEDMRGFSNGIARGQVDAIITSSKNGFSITYEINGVEYPIIRDAIGSEIHNHFWGGNNLTDKTTYRTEEFYNFYHLPKSKLLLHFERH